MVVAALGLGVAVLSAGCGTAPGAGPSGQQPAGQSAEQPAEQPAEQSGPSGVPTTDDPSLRTVEAPQLTTLDTAQASATATDGTATTADGLPVGVLGAECGGPGVRSEGYSVRAAGQFCLVSVEVVNRGAAVAAFDPSRTALVDGEGGATAPSAQALALPALAALTAQVPAATALSGTLVFDVPTGADPRELQLDGQASAALPPLG